MRNFDADIAAEINKENFRFFFLLELQLASTYRFNDIDINIYYGYELLTLDVAPGGAGWIAGDTLTGATSTKTCEIVEVLTTTTYIIKDRTGAFTLGEIISNGTDTADQGVAFPTFIPSGGYLFSPRTFSFNSLSGSANLSVESFDVDIDDTDQIMSGILLGEDVRNKIAILYFGVIETAAPTEMHIQEFVRGIVGGWELEGDSKCKINITNEMVLWNKKCLRPQSSSCPWTFRGTECTYSGSENWCDQSYARCTDLVNSDQFGGERFMPAIIEREIWWGRQRGA